MGANDYQMNYNVDMVFCIDTTGSMYPVLNMVKQNALNFYNDVTKVMTEKAKKIHQLRVRVVAYRDYLADGNTAMRVTDFFNLPEQSAEFEQCVRSLEADGGGDEPEDGLEALAYAMKVQMGQLRYEKPPCHRGVDGRLHAPAGLWFSGAQLSAEYGKKFRGAYGLVGRPPDAGSYEPVRQTSGAFLPLTCRGGMRLPSSGTM